MTRYVCEQMSKKQSGWEAESADGPNGVILLRFVWIDRQPFLFLLPHPEKDGILNSKLKP